MNNKKRRRHFSGSLEKAGKVSDAQTADLQFVQLVKERRYEEAFALVATVVDINVRDPASNANALHWAAARSAKNFIEAIAKARDDLDYLAVDGKGQRASEIAWHLARDEELGAWLMGQEKAQAERKNIPSWPTSTPS